jgi:hypothetical protein
MATATVIQDDCSRLAKVIYKVPFKIKVTNITVPSYTPTNVPPIGLAIVGVNNYIL